MAQGRIKTEGRRMTVGHVALCVISGMASVACSVSSPTLPLAVPSVAPSAKPGESVPVTQTGSQLSSDQLRVVDQRPKVSAFQIDDEIFRVSGLRVGLQDYMSSQSPALSAFMPQQADYMEVLRCRADTVIRGTFDSLVDVDLGSPSLQDEKRVLQSNDFWLAAAKANGCFLVTASFSARVFLDNAALSGGYRYVVRACVNADRLTDKELLTSRNCSKMVAISPLLQDFVNTRVERETQAFSEAQKHQDIIDGKGRQVYAMTVDLNNELVKCMNAEVNRQVNLKKRQAITSLLGFGASFGMKLLAPSGTAASAVGSQTSFGDRFKSAWADKDQIMGEGAQVASVLNNLLSSPGDFPRSCTAATKLEQDIVTATQQIKSEHELYAKAMDAAEAARRARLEMER